MTLLLTQRFHYHTALRADCHTEQNISMATSIFSVPRVGDAGTRACLASRHPSTYGARVPGDIPLHGHIVANNATLWRSTQGAGAPLTHHARTRLCRGRSLVAGAGALASTPPAVSSCPFH